MNFSQFVYTSSGVGNRSRHTFVAAARSGAKLKYWTLASLIGQSTTSCAVVNSQCVSWPRAISDVSALPRGTAWPWTRFGSAGATPKRAMSIDGSGARKFGYVASSKCAIKRGCSASSLSWTRAVRKAKPSSRRST